MRMSGVRVRLVWCSITGNRKQRACKNVLVMHVHACVGVCVCVCVCVCVLCVCNSVCVCVLTKA